MADTSATIGDQQTLLPSTQGYQWTSAPPPGDPTSAAWPALLTTRADPSLFGGVADDAASLNGNYTAALLDTGLGDLVTRAVFLGAFTVIGFVSNAVLLAVLAQGNRRRPSNLNSLLISLGVANLFDCLVNMPIVLGASITQRWGYGEAACRVNAFGVQGVSMARAAASCALSLDRCVAVARPATYRKRMTPCKVNAMIVYTWLQAATLSAPLLANAVPAHAFEARYLCSVGDGGSIVYLYLSSILAYIIPILIILSVFLYIIRKAGSERRHKQMARKLGEKYGKAMLDSDSDRAILKKEMNTSKFVGILIVLWAIIEGPYLLLSYIQQYSGYANVITPVYPWQLVVALTWIRFSYTMFLPFVTFCWRKDIWLKFKDMLLCRKSNLVDDDSDSPEQRDSFTESVGGTDSFAKKKDLPTLSFDVPVLFANEKGIHVQTLSKRTKHARSTVTLASFQDKPVDESVVGNLEDSQNSGVVTQRKCDVIGSQDLLQIDDDTSDYDSTIEESSKEEEEEEEEEKEEEELQPGEDAGDAEMRSSRHDSEVVMIAESSAALSLNNAAFEGDSPEGNPDVKPQRAGRTSNSDPKDMQCLDNGIEALISGNKPVRHVRNSSDSGRGSEEGTVSRRERMLRPSLPQEITSSQQTHVNFTVDDAAILTDVTRCDDPPELDRGEPTKVKVKRRKRKKIVDDETRRSESEEIGPDLTSTKLPESDKSKTRQRDAIQSKPLARPSPVDTPPSTVAMAVAVPSPTMQTSSQKLPTKDVGVRGVRKSDLLQLHHQRWYSECSVVIENSESVPSPVRANIAARRRRTNTIAAATVTVADDVLVHCDITTGSHSLSPTARNCHRESSSQRLAYSDSAADFRSLSLAPPGDTTKVIELSPRPSPRARKQHHHRKPELSARVDGKPALAAH